MTLPRLLISGFILLLSTGCSLVKTTYNHIDWVVSWYVTDYLELNDPQKMLLYQLIDKQHRWHRATQLPEYAKWLRAVGEDVKIGFTRNKLDGHFLRFEELYRTLLDRTAVNAAVLLATVSDQQLKDMFAVMDTYNQEFWDEYIGRPREQLQRNRIDRIESAFGFWIGSLSQKQRQAIEDWSHQRGSIAPELYRYRKLWQARFRQVLENRQSPAPFREALRELFAGNSVVYEEYEKKRVINIDLMKSLFLRIDQSLTTKQRKRFFDKLEGYAVELEQLFAQRDALEGLDPFAANLATEGFQVSDKPFR